MSIRVLIVDDEPLARQRLRDLLEEEPDFEVLAESGDGEDAIEKILDLRPDAVFLDIQMPEMSGFDVLEAIALEAMPIVVFVTAYDEYALRAFDAHALDYLMKPFHRSRFERSLERIRRQVAARGGASEAEPDLDGRLRAVLAELTGGRSSYPKRFAVRLGSRIVFVNSEEVDWIDAEGNYARLHVGPRSYLVRQTMSRLAEQLDPERFLRIHRSTIVNLDRVREIQPMFKGTYVVILSDGTQLTSTRGYRDGLRLLLEGAN
jgi:two-component system, LytTR family, response regulator